MFRLSLRLKLAAAMCRAPGWNQSARAGLVQMRAPAGSSIADHLSKGSSQIRILVNAVYVFHMLGMLYDIFGFKNWTVGLPGSLTSLLFQDPC